VWVAGSNTEAEIFKQFKNHENCGDVGRQLVLADSWLTAVRPRARARPAGHAHMDRSSRPKKYSPRDQTVRFAYVTTLLAKGRQTHVLCKAEAFAGKGIETARYKLLSVGDDACGMEKARFLMSPRPFL
jgi:hypothetical protein